MGLLGAGGLGARGVGGTIGGTIGGSDGVGATSGGRVGPAGDHAGRLPASGGIGDDVGGVDLDDLGGLLEVPPAADDRAVAGLHVVGDAGQRREPLGLGAQGRVEGFGGVAG